MGKLNSNGGWNETASKLKQKYAHLTEDDLFFKDGKEDELLERLQRQLGKTREEIHDLIEKI